ncbi:hypothetical protein ACKVB7_003704 [Klebsiella pneumoniae]|uniref:Uncharacterized protein n=1 Tax=Klebsiella pneumoniae TaxID=573 RepID=A0A486MSA5_KLEPN|nr:MULTISPECIES: hypothetical protein [Enterobacteriaceae]HBQ5873563.1 hypothetical protein [Klebsiella pneumoniae subsp. pneumoniae]EJM9047707.1 hypothetical protein [Klebsiella pneumoniae]EKV0315401.1 hypothetical protein [Klebsiella pneumoniae]EKV3478474.1 hypothetical protein [Klebsiella pneumoniae]EKV5106008.1 hypothetical protein [Klebsiella pneumoniae]
MKISLLGVGNVPLLSARIKTLDDAGLLNVSALARMLGVHRSTFLSKVDSVGLEAALLHYSAIKKQRDVLATLAEKDATAFLAACNANISNDATH